MLFTGHTGTSLSLRRNENISGAKVEWQCKAALSQDPGWKQSGAQISKPPHALRQDQAVAAQLARALSELVIGRLCTGVTLTLA